MEKPPLGVGPHWFVYPKRIENLAEAILRSIKYCIQNHSIKKTKEYYKKMAQWATEIAWLAELVAELED